MSDPEGIIYPPPDLRGIVDRTAQYVAKNGSVFEERIKREHRDKPKFSFLLPDDPFNAYYQHKVKEIRNNLLGELDSKLSRDESGPKQTDDSSNQVASNQETPQQSQDRSQTHDSDETRSSQGHQQYDHIPQQDNGAASEHNRPDMNEGGPRVRQKLNDYIQEMTMKLEEPPQLSYLASPAPSLMQKDCDIIKLTSQFVATYGRSFLIDLVSREQNNCQFDFLKPQHGQFSYMTNLIMQYALIQNQPLDITEQLNKDAYSQKHVLDKIRMRAEWTKMLELERKKREEEEEKEKLLYSQIDWHDFVIVETIDYQPEEKGEYPPTTADQVGTRLLQQQRYEEQTVPEEMDIDMDVDSDQEEEDSQGGHEFAVPRMPDLFPPDMEKVVIRKDYDPKAASKTAQSDSYFVSPITNERIPVNKISDHVKYNLSDPRHLEKKDQALQGRLNEEQVFAAGSQIQDALKNLAERRTDIFGTNDKETDIGRLIGEEEQAKSKDDRLIWDGHKSSLKKKKLN